MSYADSSAALSFGNAKVGAIYFDRVIPVTYGLLAYLNIDEPFHHGEMPVKVFHALLRGQRRVDGPMIMDSEEVRRYSKTMLKYFEDLFNPIYMMMNQDPDPDLDDIGSDNDPYEELIIKAFRRLYRADLPLPDGTSPRETLAKIVSKSGIKNYSVLIPTDDDERDFGQTYSCLALKNVPLIDSTRAEWDQIMELRKDADAIDKIRRLRLFFFENYSGRSPDYVHDDILNRLHEYEQERKKHGFEVVSSSLATLLDAKTLQATAVASLAAAMFGGPIAGLSAGAIVELGKVALEATTKHVQFRNLASGHDLAYLIEVQKRFGDK